MFTMQHVSHVKSATVYGIQYIVCTDKLQYEGYRIVHWQKLPASKRLPHKAEADKLFVYLFVFDYLFIYFGRKLPASKRFFHEAEADTFCSLLNIVHLE